MCVVAVQTVSMCRSRLRPATRGNKHEASLNSSECSDSLQRALYPPNGCFVCYLITGLIQGFLAGLR